MLPRTTEECEEKGRRYVKKNSKEEMQQETRMKICKKTSKKLGNDVRKISSKEILKKDCNK